MRTEAEVREWMTDLQGYVPMSEQQAVGLTASIAACQWVLNDASKVDASSGTTSMDSGQES